VVTTCYFDSETRSVIPIQRGTDLYARSAECIIGTWAIDDAPVQCWDALDEPSIPAELEDALRDDRVLKVAHNVRFDRAIVRHALGISTPPTSWHCTMAQAYAHGLPGSLELLCMVLNLSAEDAKLSEDGKLIQVFCVPRADDVTFWSPCERPVEWQTFKDYAVRDTHALRLIYKALPSHNFTGDNLAVWHLDQLINERGFQFDDKLARAAVELLKIAKDKHDRDMVASTHGAVQTANQRNVLLEYLQTTCGLDIPTLRANEVREMLESDSISPEVRFVLETRLEASKSSGAKYKRGLSMVGPGGRLRHAIQFNGAGRTGRFSHKGFQPGNMARPALAVYES
jgi:DNA polymerase